MKEPVCAGVNSRPTGLCHYTFLDDLHEPKACFFYQPEMIARKVIRGHYRVSFIPLIDNPTEVTEEEIMRTFVRTMKNTSGKNLRITCGRTNDGSSNDLIIIRYIISSKEFKH